MPNSHKDLPEITKIDSEKLRKTFAIARIHCSGSRALDSVQKISAVDHSHASPNLSHQKAQVSDVINQLGKCASQNTSQWLVME